MQRREWLRAIGVAGVGMLTGCQSDAAQETTTVSETPTTAKSKTTTTGGTTNESPFDSDLPDKRTYPDDEFARTEDLREFSIRSWAYKSELRYIPEGSNEMELLEPNNEVFLHFGVYMRDLKNEDRDFPDPRTFEHKSINKEIKAITELPEGINWDQISERRDKPQFSVIPLPFGEYNSSR